MTLHPTEIQPLGLGKDNLPTRTGIYLVESIFSKYDKPEEIDVYDHPIKGLSCFAPEIGSSGTEGVDDETDCHVSVQNTGLEFISRVEDLK